jgi:hypothetical protein
MSLIVASGTLDTVWSEFSTAAFTASTLGTLSDMIDEVGYKLNLTPASTTKPSDAQIANWLIRAKEEIAEAKGYTWKKRYVTATLTSSTYRYSLPPDFETAHYLRDKTNDALIRIVSNRVFDTLYPDPDEETNGDILVATIKNRELWVCPPPDGSDVLEMCYDRSGDDVTNTDISWLPEIERWRCIDFATSEAFEYKESYDKAMYYRGKWESGMRKGIRADSRRKFAGVDRARSIFQA